MDKRKRIFNIIEIGNKDDVPSAMFDRFIVVVIFVNLIVTLMQTFDQWYRYEDILKLCTVCVTSRYADGADLSAEKTPEIFQRHPLLRSTLPPFEVSSTQVRSLLRQGLPTDGLLLPAVRAYIEERGLYRDRAL